MPCLETLVFIGSFKWRTASVAALTLKTTGVKYQLQAGTSHYFLSMLGLAGVTEGHACVSLGRLIRMSIKW